MKLIEIPTIERRARALRALDTQHSKNIFTERLHLYALLFASSILSLLNTAAESLRSGFSWNPQQPSGKPSPALGIRLNRLARRLFAWNPQAQHHG